MIKAGSLILFLFLFITPAVYAQDSLQARIVLVGDAGDFKKGHHPVLDAVRRQTVFDKKTTVVFLGDNLYMTGLPDEQYFDYKIRASVLDSQMQIAGNSDAKVYFMPGNHDWDRGGKNGWNAIRRQQAYIDAHGGKNVKFYPEDGCGGPVEVDISPDVTMIIFDSQWWIHPFDKPGIQSDCPYKTKTEVLSQMEDILARNSKKLVIMACHHPFKSYGIHGGYFTLKQHIFPFTEMWPKLYIPLPVIGSIYPIARGVFGTPQDLKHPAYANMIKDVTKVVRDHPNVVFVSGHEHNLQLIKDSSYNYIISGSGTKNTRVSKNKHAPFTSQLNGYALLEISKNKNVDVTFFTVKDDSASTAYHAPLLSFAQLKKEKSDSSSPKSVPVPLPFKDSVSVVANAKYNKASGAKRFILGNNYRKEWATPVHLKVFNISKEKGGFKIESLGGGKQTKSLRLTDKNGREWTLRTINKDPEKAVPDNLRGSLAQDIVQDMISTANPYAPLTIPPLAKSLGVTAPSPEFFFVPDDPALGFYRPLFANTVCLLEEREPGSKPDDTKSTVKVLNKLLEDNDNHVDQEATLKARLLDLLIGDWDRHFDQWRFGTGDTGKGKLYFPIPRDRDQAYFNSDGLLIKAVSQNVLPYLKGFKKTIPKVNWLSWEARDFDRIFMNNLDAKTWRNTLDTFHSNLTDAVITNAVKKLPPEVFAISGQTIIDKLKSRRDLLCQKDGMKYYRFLSKEVNVVGSNKNEYFNVTHTDSGVHVMVYKRKKDNDSSSVMFNRFFDSKYTKEIRLYGLNGEDYFNIDDSVRTKIKVRIIGGRGADTFDVKGNLVNYIYDLNTEKNYITHPRHSQNMMSADPAVNEFDVTSYNYDIYRFPQVNIGFNPEDRVMVGIGWLRRTHSFRKEPFSTQQKITSLYAFNRGSYQFRYLGEFNHTIGTKDIVINGEMVHPVLNNFYGIGNNTTNTLGKEFYRVRYNYVQGEVLLRQRLGKVVQVLLGPKVYNYWNRPDDNRGKILSNPGLFNLDSANVYSTKTYGGGKFAIVINNVNSDLLPTRGIYWNTELSSVYGMNKRSNNLTKLTSDLTLYSSLSDPAKVVTVLHAGAGRILNNNYEYFQALNLGANNYLRGFRKNRFSGSSLAYGSFELRVKLFQSKSYVFPGDVGLIGFNDVGRVWVKNEESKKWHYSYGGGLYYSLYNIVLVSATLGISEEEKLFNFSIGSKINIIF